MNKIRMNNVKRMTQNFVLGLIIAAMWAGPASAGVLQAPPSRPLYSLDDLIALDIDGQSRTFAQRLAQAEQPAGEQPVQPNGEQPAQPGEAQPPQPPAQPAAEQLRIVVTVVFRMAAIRRADAEPNAWEPARVGMELNPADSYQTGPNSLLQFRVLPHALVTVDRHSEGTVMQAIRQAGQLKTDVSLKHGRVRFQIRAGEVEHESKIHAPSATLAVRGTDGLMQDDALGARAVIYETPSVDLTGRNGTVFPILRGAIRLTRKSVPDTSKEDATVDAGGHWARTDAERGLIEDNPLLIGNDLGLLIETTAFRQHFTSGQSRRDIIDGFDISSVFFNDGDLRFDLAFTGFADVDLSVDDPAGFTASVFPGVPPGSTRMTPTGGMASADALGPSGMESVVYSGRHPAGDYLVRAGLFEFEGSGAANFTVTVTQQLPGQSPVVLNTFTGALDQNNPLFEAPVNVPTAGRRGGGTPQN